MSLEQKHGYKAVFLGDSSVGKTSLIERISRSAFSSCVMPTVGATCVKQQIETPHGTTDLNIWDTAGQEKFRSLIPIYLHNTNIAIIVFDLNNFETFNNLDNWVLMVEEGIGDKCPIICAANKNDLYYTSEDFNIKISEWARQKGIQVIFVSAYTGERVEELYKLIVKTLLQLPPDPSEHPSDNGRLVNSGTERKCCKQ